MAGETQGEAGQASLADDRLDGMRAIAEFVGVTRRKAFYLGSMGLLPGVFREGGCWVGFKSQIAAGYRRKASREAA